MSRSPSHTQEEVFAAADDLTVKGVKVTQASLREALGNTGGFTTLARHIAAWKLARDLLPTTDISIPDGVLGVFDQLWQHACREAAKSFAMEAHGADSEEAAGRSVDATAPGAAPDPVALRRLQTRLDSANSMLDGERSFNMQLLDKLVKHEAQIRDIEAKNLHLRTEYGTQVNGLNASVRDKARQVTMAEREVKSMQRELDAEREKSAALAAELAALKANISQE